MAHFIYMLFDNISNQPLYVGATKFLKERLVNHRNTTLKNYINAANVTMEVLEEVSEKTVVLMEQFWYGQIKSWGFALLQHDCRLYRVPKVFPFTIVERGILADAFNRTIMTIERWIEAGDNRLTSDVAKNALKKKK